MVNGFDTKTKIIESAPDKIATILAEINKVTGATPAQKLAKQAKDVEQAVKDTQSEIKSILNKEKTEQESIKKNNQEVEDFWKSINTTDQGAYTENLEQFKAKCPGTDLTKSRNWPKGKKMFDDAHKKATDLYNEWKSKKKDFRKGADVLPYLTKLYEYNDESDEGLRLMRLDIRAIIDGTNVPGLPPCKK